MNAKHFKDCHQAIISLPNRPPTSITNGGEIIKAFRRTDMLVVKRYRDHINFGTARVLCSSLASPLYTIVIAFFSTFLPLTITDAFPLLTAAVPSVVTFSFFLVFFTNSRCHLASR